MAAHGGSEPCISERRSTCFDLNLYAALIVLLLESQPTNSTNLDKVKQKSPLDLPSLLAHYELFSVNVAKDFLCMDKFM